MDLTFLNDIDATIMPHALLSDLTTFRLGGKCPAAVACCNATVLRETVMRLRAHKIPLLMTGFGSNILASDHGLNKVIVRFSSTTPLLRREAHTIIVDAATQLDALISFAIEQGFEGLTSLIGIPGTVGGAIAGNAGAYGEQISDRLTCVTVLRPDNSVVTLRRESIRFAYRDSELKHNGDIILNAEFDLHPCQNMNALHAKRDEIIANRKFKLDFWKEYPCAGSFFRNVEPSSNAGHRQAAGWFLEQAGTKGLAIGGAHAYSAHANIITCAQGTKAQSVYDLSVKMAAMVKEKFNIDLVREVRMLGKFDNAPDCDPENYW